MAALKGVKTLDMVDGEITKVSYEGSEYERVEGGAKVGDIIRLTEEAHHDVTPGGFYTVREVRGARVRITDDVNEPHHWDEEYYDIFRKKHTRLKVGDYAKVVDDSGQDAVTKGDFVKITEDDETTLPFKCDVVIGKSAGGYVWARESELVLATEAEVAAAKEAEAKRSIEAKWAKIGRKVDEYKVGDIVAYDDPNWFKNEGVGKVVEDIDVDGDIRIDAVDHRGSRELYYLSTEKLTLITPVEARFDRS
ncbi:hypothetical protein [Bacillus sp. RSS_NA_20]|uniref:hypothetical protein n=1 Tax=Bacillus sp. RSS_NA_20 TaxID=2876777 RepID=UPI001CCC00A9|nr:hypothetical protein [Bacillus sp. RSS_NA_20]MCA0117398.1 hypothetical protein [Bacillus sp. RSS_NA_20]